MLDGWIKLHRKIRENPVFNDMQLFRLWIICLTEATYKERDQLIGKQVVHLMPGEFVTGRFDLQGMYNRGLTGEQQKSPATVWRWLEVLKNGDFLSIKSSNKFSVVAILGWHKYQSDEQQNEQQMSNKRATDEQQMSTNKKEKKENKVNKDNNKELIAEIINYLNATTGKMFSPDTKESIKLISGRLTDGRTVEQFKKVIDVKTKEWLHEEKTNAWLKPATLFAQSNFEAYLNQAPKTLSHDEVDEIARRKWMNAGNDPADFKGADRSGGVERSSKTNTKPGASLDGWEALVNIH